MPLPSCDLFPFATADGPTHMAADEALLEYATATGRAALRFYAWAPPTLSLGYFQPAAARLPDLPYVRRPTGGGAIVHHHELTYALTVPSGPHQKGANWACRMHDVIRVALEGYGVPASACGCGHERGRGAFLCFEHQTPGDVLLAEHKIVGSAQRRRAGALLQHGSILLAASPHAPHLSGLAELLGVAIAPGQLADELARTFVRLTDWALLPADWSPALASRRDELAATRYRSPAWNDRR